ncbi:hypothetical protein [Mesorhizobium sp. B1-1-9]|uniref:hypothetical protein n=1 Tax=Mesorhizobium sp. B1-1-9 TaxID=2589975 RepID=UPI0015E47519|nr:hypothetical protein [Mesorhizobium sp. B1-1-9]
MVEENRSAFKRQFGSFEEAAFDCFWLGTSEDGAYLAFQFYRPDGSIHRFALPASRVQRFFTEFAGSSDEMGERQIAAAFAKAEPKGQA